VLSGAISMIWAKIVAARSPSPCPRISSPIAISGATSCGASSPGAPGSTGSWDRIWSRYCFNCDSALGQVGHRLALEHRIDRRDRAHLKLRGDELFLVDIDLGEDHALVGIVSGDLFQNRGQRLARPAPFGPEVEDDELGHRRFDDRLAEAVNRLLFVEVEAQACHYLSPLQLGSQNRISGHHVGNRPGSARGEALSGHDPDRLSPLGARRSGLWRLACGKVRENANLLLRPLRYPVIGPPHPSGSADPASH
jgi:hypothetical protein